MGQERRKCPFCEEVVLDDATVCHYCGRELRSPGGDGGGGGQRTTWQTVRTFLVIVVVAIALIALVFVIQRLLARPAPLPVMAILEGHLATS